MLPNMSLWSNIAHKKMKYNILLTGVGGEGVLTIGALLARAANFEGYFVRGVQLHGLAQRGGIISASVCFGDEKEVFSPKIMQADADLIIAFEPVEAIRATYYALKNKTSFVINNCPQIPIYANIFDIPYPKIDKVLEKIEPFAKSVLVFNTKNIAKESFGSTIFGNVILIGAVFGAGLLPLKEENLYKAISETSPSEPEKNLEAFKLGLSLGKNKAELFL